MYFNELDPFPAQWLRNLWPGATVDERDVNLVRPEDVSGFQRAHFFAGIGGWEYALQLAGWPKDRPVWTGSCPCQPFSNAGKRRGTDDERHLWPAWLRLISECRPPTIFGEQVASRLGREWLAGVRADLEALGYAVGAADLCAAGVGAPHIRQRLFWVAHSERRPAEPRRYDLAGTSKTAEREAQERQRIRTDSGPSSDVGGLAHSTSEQVGRAGQPRSLSDGIGMGNADTARLPQRQEPEGRGTVGHKGAPAFSAGSLDFWFASDWLPCADGKARRVEPGTFPLAHGVPARVGRLRAYGNAIVPQVAAVFVRSFLGVD